MVSLANTGEPLFQVNRSGNSTSSQDAGGYLDRSIELCRQAGFRRIRLRNDTDFSQARYLDGWDDDGVQFVFGIAAMPKLVEVRVIFSQRRNDKSMVALVTNNMKRSMVKRVADYLKRWAIEVMIKDQKQHLGLGDYRCRRYRAVVRHLHLVDCAYACLTHVGIQRHTQGNNKTRPVLSLEPISQLQRQLRQIIWQEEIKNVIKVSHDKKVIRRLEKLLAA